ncbi:MAG: hypothetical protein PHH00_01100 [Candidatus Nanoarchaeia archaeon]|nr:hypothetical protein [Candidatus Nanoarchaeia archaeon]
MELKRVVTLAIFAVLLIAGFLVYFDIYLKQPHISGYALSNGKDEHGCLVRSGFRWDNSTQACTKSSGNKTIIYQVSDFQSCLDAGYAINENNKTHLLQCQTLNGTLFVNININNSTKITKANMNAKMNASKPDNTTNYPDNVTLMSNFSITNIFNS